MILVRAELRVVEAALAGDDVLAETIGYDVVPGWATFTGALDAVQQTLAVDPAGVEWGPRLFVAGDPPRVVGWGGFKGPPSGGTVELGYEIAADLRGQGLATAAARALLAEAFADPQVTTVIAHTLAEPNASNHILDKLGFHHDAELLEDHQPVWRYALERPPAASP